MADLRAKASGEHHALQEHGRGHTRILELIVEAVGDVQVDIEAGVVEELERSHPVGEAELHGGVDLLHRRDALLERADRAEEVGDHQPVHDEAGRVLADDTGLAEGGDELAERGDRRLAGGDGPDDLDERHHRRRIEEVQAGDPIRPLRRGGHLDDREAGGVRGEDRSRRAQPVERAEHLLFRGHLLDDGLDHEVAVLQVLERRGATHPAASRLRVVLRQLGRLHDARERGIDPGEALVEKWLRDLAHDRLVARLGAHLRDA